MSAAGHPDGNWSVELPVEEVPPELPEPVLGINFARDGEAEGRVAVRQWGTWLPPSVLCWGPP